MDMENRLVVAKGEVGGSGMDRVLGVNRYKLLHLEWQALSFPRNGGSKVISKILHIYLISRTQAREKFEHLTGLYLTGNGVHMICSK